MRTITTALLATTVLILAACGDDSSTASLSAGDCTDVDPTFVIEVVTPDKVDCDSKKAKSKVSKVADSKADCKTEALIQRGDSTFYCLEPVGETFRGKIGKLDKKAQARTDEVKKRIKEATKNIPTTTTPKAPPEDLNKALREGLEEAEKGK